VQRLLVSNEWVDGYSKSQYTGDEASFVCVYKFYSTTGLDNEQNLGHAPAWTETCVAAGCKSDNSSYREDISRLCIGRHFL
jgi:hypothetical protein